MDFLETAELLTSIDSAAESGDTDRALQLALANLSQIERDGILRERIARTFAEEGDAESAATIYRRVGLHYANAGFPARSLAAAKKAERLGARADELYGHFTALYNLRSPNLDQGERHESFGGADGTLDMEAEGVQIRGERLRDIALERSLEEDAFADRPEDLPPLPLASRLPADSLERLARAVELVEFDELADVRTDDRGPGALIWTASPDLTLGDDDPTYYLPMGVLLGLEHYGPASAPPHDDVVARAGSEILVLSQQTVDQLNDELGNLQERLSTLHRHAFTTSLLDNHPLFDPVPSDERRALLDRFAGVHVEKGESVVDTRGESPGLFIVLDGRAELVRRGDDTEITVTSFGPGDVFGELGLVSEEPTGAEIVAVTDGHLLFLPSDQFDAIVADYPQIAKYTVNLAKSRRELIEESASPEDLEEVSS
ncbi:MAG: cyclic nucleotide-binding domain-containing protein [Bradymonadaceae bacterium]